MALQSFFHKSWIFKLAPPYISKKYIFFLLFIISPEFDKQSYSILYPEYYSKITLVDPAWLTQVRTENELRGLFCSCYYAFTSPDKTIRTSEITTTRLYRLISTVLRTIRDWGCGKKHVQVINPVRRYVFGLFSYVLNQSFQIDLSSFKDWDICSLCLLHHR